jgi:hypothetical protein
MGISIVIFAFFEFFLLISPHFFQIRTISRGTFDKLRYFPTFHSFPHFPQSPKSDAEGMPKNKKGLPHTCAAVLPIFCFYI